MMTNPKLLLDTHAAIWFGVGSRKFPARLRRKIVQEGAYLSVLSPVELALKEGRRRYKLPLPLKELLEAGIKPLPLRFGVLDFLRRLPPIHDDPFDRLLVAQAMQEGLTLATADEKLAHYAIPTYWE